MGKKSESSQAVTTFGGIDVKRAAEVMTTQYKVVENAKTTMLRECVKFGAMLLQWERYIGGSVGGRGHRGDGLKGWMEENCPEIGYKSAMAYKALAEKAVKMLGGGAMAIAAVQGDETVTDPNGETIDVDAKVIEMRDAIFDEATSRRKMEKMYFAFSAEATKGKAGRPVGSVAEYKKKSEVECAVAIVWPMVQHMLKHRGELFASYQILPTDKLTEVAETLKEQFDAVNGEIKGRK